MDYVLIVLVSFAASLLTFFAGFGLGTILMPAFALFFPIEMAVAAAGVVHFANNIFKFALLRKQIHWKVVLLFGLPAMLAAWAGAKILLHLTSTQPIFSYFLGGSTYHVTTIKVIIACLLLVFALIDVIPALRKINFSHKWLVPGGFISGFFGGLSGHQGALRTAFLIKAGLSKTAFVATGVAIACLVDIGRLGVYAGGIRLNEKSWDRWLIFSAMAAALAGTILGSRWLKKITLPEVQYIVFGMLIIIAVLLGLGLI